MTSTTAFGTIGIQRPETCTLSLHGFSDNDTNVFRSMVTLFSHKLSTNWNVVSNSDRADMHVVDVDSPEGRLQWQALPNECTKVAYASRPLVGASQPLRKPLFGKQVCQLLQESGESLMMSRRGGMPLFDHLESQSFTTAVRIDCGEQLPELWIDLRSQRYLFNCDLEQICPQLATPIIASELDHVSRFEWQQRASRVAEQPLSRLRWYAAWATSSRKLTPTLCSRTPLRLIDWPDIECHRPELLRLAGHLLNQAISFRQLLKETRIDRNVVAAFVNTCFRCGLIGLPDQAGPSSDTVTAEYGSGLFSRIRAQVGL